MLTLIHVSIGLLIGLIFHLLTRLSIRLWITEWVIVVLECSNIGKNFIAAFIHLFPQRVIEAMRRCPTSAQVEMRNGFDRHYLYYLCFVRKGEATCPRTYAVLTAMLHRMAEHGGISPDVVALVAARTAPPLAQTPDPAPAPADKDADKPA